MTAKPLTITDPVFKPRERYNALDRALLTMLNDERDLPFAHFIIQSVLVLIPFAVVLFVPGVFRWWLGALYLALNVPVFMDRFILILHNTSHRTLFKPRYRAFNQIIPWLLGPFYGETPETYFAHHLGMHHREGNLPKDLSSTMRFQRDSVWHFLQYQQRFFWMIVPDLSRYMNATNRRKLKRRMLTGEFGFYALVAGLSYVNWRATFVVFVVPFLIARFVMMAGNWAQHAFVDPRDPKNDFLNSLTVVNCRYNRRCFNDGYHIGHHRKANRHWTEMPVEFQQDKELYIKHDAIVFEGIDFLMVWFYLMTKQYGVLAKHFVRLDGKERSDEEVIALLKSRTKPILGWEPRTESAPAPQLAAQA